MEEYMATIKTLKGTIKMHDGAGKLEIDYPQGFNLDNCVPVAFGLHNTQSNIPNAISYGYGPYAVDYVRGSIPRNVQLCENKIILSISNAVAHGEGEAEYNYKLVLMMEE
jgi:hypothetical protein